MAAAVYDRQTDDRLLSQDASGYWTGFQAGAQDGDPYRFWIVGEGSSGYKRDPYARELAPNGFPACCAILRASDAYPWHDAGFRTPDFSDMTIYQLHVGTYAIRTAGVASNFLDVTCKIPYLAALGMNVLQPLPIDEQEANPSMGYGGADLFSPDFPYVAAAADLPGYLATINGLLAARQLAPLRLEDLRSGPAQLKAMVDLCHVYGIAVVFDVVYNHAGGFTVNGQLDDNCIYYFDRVRNVGNNNDSLYFTDQDRGTGGLAFALWNADVCQFLSTMPAHYIEEFHADGFRYDEISILLSTNQGSGWEFCRALTDRLRTLHPRILQNAEFWPGEFSDIPSTALPVVAPASAGGAGFDVVQHDGLRGALRNAVGAASGGSRCAGFRLDHRIRALPAGLRPCLARGHLHRKSRPCHGRPQPAYSRAGRRADHRSWYARSRSRFATAVLLTAPGIPQLFMGQEFLEDKPWDTNLAARTCWVGRVEQRRRSCHDGSSPLYPGSDPASAKSAGAEGRQCERILCIGRGSGSRFHRWLEGAGQDVIVVASLAESTW